RPLGLAAGERPLELLAERLARSEDQRLDRSLAQLKRLGDLQIRATLELAQRERRPLGEREGGERPADVISPEALSVILGGGQPGVERDLGRTACRRAEALTADVVRDRDQPVQRLRRKRARAVRTVGVEERGLGDVLRIRAVRKDGERIPV